MTRPLRPPLNPEDRRFAAGERRDFSTVSFRVKEGRKEPGDLVLEWRTWDGWTPIGYEALGYLIDFFYENEHWLYPSPYMGGEKLRVFIAPGSTEWVAKRGGAASGREAAGGEEPGRPPMGRLRREDLMAILGLQRRIREVGRIRMGDQAVTSTGRKAPRKLTTFRLSSPDRTVIEAAAHIYGGTAQAWNNNGSAQFEVFTEADQLRIALPPDPADLGWSQWYEQWRKAFCSHRCDGVRETVGDGPCTCDPENRECKPTSRLSVFLPDIPGLGVWRLESHGYYAAVELAGAIEIITAMAGAHSIVPARLRLDPREVRRIVDGKPKVHQFVVPVIDLDVSIMAVRAITTATGTPLELPAAEDPEPGDWQPVPAVEAPEVLSIESQLKELDTPKAKPARKNAAAPIKATGRAPHKASNAPATTCSVCNEPYGTGQLVKNPDPDGSRFVHRSCVPAIPSAGASDGATGEPPPPVAPITPDPPVGPRSMTHNQHRKLMATVAECFPVGADVTGPAVDSYRREVTLAMVTALTGEVLESRTAIDWQTANLMLDALEKMKAGDLFWDPDSESFTEAPPR